MILIQLAIKSIASRKLTMSLVAVSIAISVMLLLSVEHARRFAQTGFTHAISQTDFVVGGRTSSVNLVLFSIFNIGHPTNNISWETFEKFKDDQRVDWVIPYSLGDSHQGFRVIGTDSSFYKYYRFRNNQQVEFLTGFEPKNEFDVVIGYEVQQKLKYKIDDEIIITHGVTKGEGVQHHDDQPFKIVGILKPTGTAIDQSVYMSLQGMDAIHHQISPQKNAQGNQHKHHHTEHKDHDESEAHDDHDEHDHHHSGISAFFMKLKNRTQILSYQREINNYKEEALVAAIPAATLTQVWENLSQIEKVLKLISHLVLVMGLISMLSTLMAGLNERRREMAVLRSLGARPLHITMLLVFESGLLTFIGIVAGVCLEYLTFQLLSHWLKTEYGLYPLDSLYSLNELSYLCFVFICGIIIGFVPAIRSVKAALKDGLSF